jgi:hypothetical protein
LPPRSAWTGGTAGPADVKPAPLILTPLILTPLSFLLFYFLNASSRTARLGIPRAAGRWPRGAPPVGPFYSYTSWHLLPVPPSYSLIFFCFLSLLVSNLSLGSCLLLGLGTCVPVSCLLGPLRGPVISPVSCRFLPLACSSPWVTWLPLLPSLLWAFSSFSFYLPCVWLLSCDCTPPLTALLRMLMCCLPVWPFLS